MFCKLSILTIICATVVIASPMADIDTAMEEAAPAKYEWCYGNRSDVNRIARECCRQAGAGYEGRSACSVNRRQEIIFSSCCSRNGLRTGG
jgi:hypothetical protein